MLDLTHHHTGSAVAAGGAAGGASAGTSGSMGAELVQDLLLDRPPSPARLAYTSEKHPRSTFNELNLIRKSHELCDVVINVGNRKIFAHR